MELLLKGLLFKFVPVPLSFKEIGLTNLFAFKNNKTVIETLDNARYQHLRTDCIRLFPESVNEPLGIFLGQLKDKGNVFYRRFLNQYGDLTYCHFSITDCLKAKGLYCFAVDNEIKYIGRSHDPYGKRINAGYGRIAPKNCYLDGQATNCHLNTLVTGYMSKVSFFIYPLHDDAKIDLLERELIKEIQPEWNIALKK